MAPHWHLNLLVAALCLMGSSRLQTTGAQAAAAAATAAASSASGAESEPPLRRQFILVFDAGSTGTRLNVFEFRVDRNHSTGLRIMSLKEKKISPGLSSYANAPERLRGAMKPLMDFAKDNVPADFQSDTTAIVRATAGLRLLEADQRRDIIRVVAEVLRRSSFLVPDQDKRAVRVISGQEEAEYGWVAVNFLMDTFDQAGGDTYGMLDLGGGSTQITFVPRVDDRTDSYRMVFQTVRGKVYALHEHSYLGLGMSQAALYMFNHSDSEPQKPVYLSACLSPSYSSEFSFGPVRISVAGDPAVTDSDRLARCSKAAREPLKKVPVHQPPGVKVAKFVAVSSFFYTASMLSDGGFLPSNVTIPGDVAIWQLEAAADRVCQQPPTTGQYQPYLCMNTVYIVTLLRDGYKFSVNQSLYITDSINGYSANWPLGIAIHHLTCHDRDRHVCLDSGAVAVAASLQPPASSFQLMALAALVTLIAGLRDL